MIAEGVVPGGHGTRDALWGGMHDVAFRFKRAHLTAVAWHKELIKKWCREDLRVCVEDIRLTPARFDVMVIVRAAGGSCLQSELWQRLGLHASTICKMLKRMELAGLVVRSEGLDRRERYVDLTRKGLDVIIGALKKFVRSNLMHDAYAAIHRRGAEFINEAIDTLKHLAWGLADSSTYGYPLAPWTADDIEKSEARDAVVRKDVERCEPNPAPLATTETTDAPPDYFSPAYWGAHWAQMAQGGDIAEAARKRLAHDTNAILAAAEKAEAQRPQSQPSPDIYDPEYWVRHHADIARGGDVARAARERLARDMASSTPEQNDRDEAQSQ